MAGNLKAKVTFLADTKGLLKGVEKVERKFNQLGNTLEKHSRVLMGAGLAIGAGLGVAVKVAGDFDQSLRNMASVAKPTVEEFEAIHDMALKLGRESIHGPRKLAEVTYALASAGMKAAMQMKVLPGISMLAAATQFELARSTALTVAALNQFGYSADETDRVINVFAASTQVSQARMDLLEQSMSEAGATAGQFGMDIEDVVAPLAAFYDAGVKASTAGTSFKNIILLLNKGAPELDALLTRLGLTLADVSPETHTVAEAFQVMADAGATAIDMTTAFGQENATVAAVLMSSLDKIERYTKGITGTKAAYEMAKLQAEGFGQTLALTKAALEGAGIAVGEVLLPSVKDLAIIVTTAAIAFSDLSPTMQKFIVYGTTATTGTLFLGGAIGWMLPYLKSFTGFLSLSADKLAYWAIGVKSATLAGLGIAGGLAAIGAAMGISEVRMNALAEAEGDWAKKREGIFARMQETGKMFAPDTAEYADAMAGINKELMALADAYWESADRAKVAAEGIEDVGEAALTASERAEALVTSLIEGVTAAFDKVGTAAGAAVDPFAAADAAFRQLVLGMEDLSALEKADLLLASIATSADAIAARLPAAAVPMATLGATIAALPDPVTTFGDRWLAAGALAGEGFQETLRWLTDIEGHMTTAIPGAGDAMVGAFARVYGELGSLDKATWKTLKKSMAGGMKSILDMYIDMTLGKLLATKIQAIAALGMGAFLNPANLGFIALVGGIYGAAKAAISGINSFDESAVITRGGSLSGNVSIGDVIVSPDAMKNFMKGGGGRSLQVSVTFNGSYAGDSVGFRDDIDYLVERVALEMER